ncbi:MAG: prephenate dehydratase [Tenuifilum sp.]|jgi:prephenate dehydratase|uniref:prephenate dehydratase n=1 Tax=Tenuifilum sp. TaxID=2760880 RepID=UPI0024AB962D|nr:prephenate dehydratase domain-containing protein [Tenuifilum sp.]MDI3526479.1 prephenate dehydratase [Tenuifilum sp.]
MKEKVAIQGFKGSFHQEAAEKYFGTDIEIAECLTFQQLVKAVSEGAADKGIMAIENFVAGSLLPNYSLLRDSDLQIEGEVFLRISQHLIALPEQSINNIREIQSHPMAIAQCDKFLHSLHDVRIVSTDDTALSAKLISENKLKGVAAIASEKAAEIYGLKPIAKSIENNPNNYTRFVVIGKTQPAEISEVANKASIAFALQHKVGSLQKALSAFSRYGVNLTLLQSLPQVGSPWEYYFHADLVFRHRDDFELAIIALKQNTSYLKTFGIYKEANINRNQNEN